MKVALVTPWDNAWVPLYAEAFQRRGHAFTHCQGQPEGAFGLVLHGWASGASQPVPGARNVMFMRRYELFDGGISRVDWRGVDHLVCVNNWIADVIRRTFRESGIKTPVSTIYNAADPRIWRYAERKGNHRVGMSCHVHPKKNLPLALQVMAMLPPDYELHIAGALQDACTAEYLNHVGRILRRKVYLYGHIERAELDGWWELMGVCLSTSLSEGNPNNVIEAMAKGIKPVVHDWPGAREQFGTTFATAAEAAGQILAPEYDSAAYRAGVEEKFSLANIERVVDLALA